MRISELRDYLAKYVGEGKGDAEVLICKFGENPLEAECEIKDAVFLRMEGWRLLGCYRNWGCGKCQLKSG